MAKLPKKKTMFETINRVMGYSSKLYMNGKIATKQYNETVDTLYKLIKSIEKV